MKLTTIPRALVILFSSHIAASAAITGVTETNVGGDTPAIIAQNFGEEALTFSDRTHQHNGAAFDGGGILSTAGTTIIDLPDYLVGNDYVRFANNARDNAGYSADIATDVPSTFYLLLDNRINGPLSNTSSPNSTDPDLGGTFQWVIDGGWERVNTGISPNGQSDYTGVDEGGESFGPGIGLNQFYSVYSLPDVGTSTTVSNNGTGGSNMISLVAVPFVNEEDPIGVFAAVPPTISEGEMSNLTWIIHPDATVGTIDNGEGDILPVTNEGEGMTAVSPAVTTTYTLSVESPEGDDTAETTVTVRLINSFTGDENSVEPGGDLTLSWDTRSDASVSISEVGAVASDMGSTKVNPTESTTYMLTATAGAETETATFTVFVTPTGTLFAVIDVGGNGGTAEPGAIGGQIGAGPDGTNGMNLAETNLTSDTGVAFSIAIDNIAPDGSTVGGLDWRDRGDSNGQPLTALGEDLVKNNAGMLRVTISGLPAGQYDVLSWHYDGCCNGQSEAIQTFVTDANGVAVDTGVVGTALATVNPDVNTTADMIGHVSQYLVESNGNDPVIIYFDGRLALDTEVPLNGLRISEAGTPVPLQIVSITHDTGENTVTIEFTSREGREYAVSASSDLGDFVEELDDSIPGQKGTTTFTELNVDETMVPRRFYRVFEP